MKFFIEFLNRFSATDILHMYNSGAFRTSEEIRQANNAINYKIIFNDDQLSVNDLRIYRHLQRVIDTIRAQKIIQNRPAYDALMHQEEDGVVNTQLVNFKYFCKFGENQREVKRLNILERRLIFSFQPIPEGINPIVWLAEALDELLSYVMRDFEATDRVGLVIQYENYPEKPTAISIRLKNQLTTCVVKEALCSAIQSNKTVITNENMTLQVVRIRLPLGYMKHTNYNSTVIINK